MGRADMVCPSSRFRRPSLAILPGQTLRLVLPWPAPGPHAPLYVWLRGEQTGRKTAVTF